MTKIFAVFLCVMSSAALAANADRIGPTIDPTAGCTAGMAMLYGTPNGLQCVPVTTTIGSLPACGAGLKGARMVVTDALLPAALAVVSAGGAVVVSVMCNGTAWIVG